MCIIYEEKLIIFCQVLLYNKKRGIPQNYIQTFQFNLNHVKEHMLYL